MQQRNFSSGYQTSPTVTVIYSGYDHRSWIDVMISYNEIFRDKAKSIFDKNYHHQTITKSTTVIKTIPNATDQVVVFSFSNSVNDVILSIHGKSYKTFKMIKNINIHNQVYSTFNLLLRWSLLLQSIIPGFNPLVALQGKFLQLNLDLYSQCKVGKTCPVVKAFWIPEQLVKYRDEDLHNRPQKCFIQNQLNLTDKMYCLNFSTVSPKLNYVYISSLPTGVQDMLVNVLNNRNLISWNIASSVCKHVGGVLPIIRSKSQLNELVALISFSKYIPPQDKFFIGLSSMISKVSCFVYCNRIDLIEKSNIKFEIIILQ